MSQTASIFLSLSVALLAGLLLSRLAKKVQLPAVTAYLVAGVLIGPFVLGRIGIPGIGITGEQIEGFGLVSDLALGFIAFSMGSEFRIAQLKKIGKQATFIGVFQALFTTVIVDAALIGLHLILNACASLKCAVSRLLMRRSPRCFSTRAFHSHKICKRNLSQISRRV